MSLSSFVTVPTMVLHLLRRQIILLKALNITKPFQLCKRTRNGTTFALKANTTVKSVDSTSKLYKCNRTRNGATFALKANTTV